MSKDWNYRLPTGTILMQRYRIEAVLGEGGFGITYKATDTLLEIKVAIKEYYPRGCAIRYANSSLNVTISDTESSDLYVQWKERFLQEARILAQCSSIPSIVSAFNFFEENDTAYIVMEFLDGIPLKKLVKEKGVMDGRELASLMLPLIRSLHRVHKRSLLHRDISPENIMLMPDSTLKLYDFGAARMFDQEQKRSMSVVLKHGYAPPEQYRIHGEQGPWTDIYALCATMYFCITSMAPESSIDRMLDNGKLARPSDCGRIAPVDKELEDIIIRGLSIRYEDRYQSAELLATAIEHYLNQEKGEEETPKNDDNDRTIVIHKIPDKRDYIETEVDQNKKRSSCIVNDSTTEVISKTEVADKRNIQNKEGPSSTNDDNSGDKVEENNGSSDNTVRNDVNGGERNTSKEKAVLTSNTNNKSRSSMSDGASTAVPDSCLKHGLGVGAYVTFGKYPQTRSGIDNTPIEWQVLVINDSKALLISRYGLDAKPYNEKYADITWETSSLRKWLNSDFIKIAFSETEQDALQTTTVNNSKSHGNSSWYPSNNANTLDKVFLLSYLEVCEYFKVTEDNINMKSRVAPTEYAIKQGADTSNMDKTLEGKPTCWWWLRSQGTHKDNAAIVFSNGSLDVGPANYANYAIRPAIWIDIESAFHINQNKQREHKKTDCVSEINDDSINVNGNNRIKESFPVSYSVIPRHFILFGKYPQTEHGNDNTPIEWQVLDVQGDYALLLSRFGLDCQQFHNVEDIATWKNSTLREWLNSVFLNKAFNSFEQERIMSVIVDNGIKQGNPKHYTSGGDHTQDKVFLLSYNEANEYLAISNCSFNNTEHFANTAYAHKKLGQIYKNNRFINAQDCGWWLRSPGENYTSATQVYKNIAISKGVNWYSYIRPAIWIKIEKSLDYGTRNNVEKTLTGKAHDYKVGDAVFFGSYRQDKDEGTFGFIPKPIEWQILDKQESKVLLLSRYCLAIQAYNSVEEDITWENSSLREWLNDVFYRRAFNKSERKLILITEVDNGPNQCNSRWSTYGGNNTNDRVFLLSHLEMNKYLTNTTIQQSIDKKACLTAYALQQLEKTSSYQLMIDGKTVHEWWLRSPGQSQHKAEFVNRDGCVKGSGKPVDSYNIAIRPAIWIDLNNEV